MRTYRLVLPKAFSGKAPLPLVVVLHGAGADGKMTEALTGFSELAEEKGFAVVYPDGQKMGQLPRFWVFFADKDSEFLLALVDRLVDRGVADRRRVYVTGISSGAYMTNRFAMDHADRIAAIAPVAGTLGKERKGQKGPARRLPVLYVHGVEDKIVERSGRDAISRRELSMSAEDYVRYWVEHNKCGTKPEVKQLDGQNDGTSVERKTYRSADGEADVVFYNVEGGGHTWPGGRFQPEFLLGKTSRDFNATQAMWEFFEKCRLPATGE